MKMLPSEVAVKLDLMVAVELEGNKSGGIDDFGS